MTPTQGDSTKMLLAALLGSEAAKPPQPGPRERLAERLVHGLRGCRPVPLYVFDPGSQRLVQVGRLCPVCETAFGIDERSTNESQHR
jgi:hypothetical protein